MLVKGNKYLDTENIYVDHSHLAIKWYRRCKGSLRYGLEYNVYVVGLQGWSEPWFQKLVTHDL